MKPISATGLNGCVPVSRRCRRSVWKSAVGILLFALGTTAAAFAAPTTGPAQALARLSAALGAPLQLGEVLTDTPFNRGPDAAWEVQFGETRSKDGAVIVVHTAKLHSNYDLNRPFRDVLVRFSFQLLTASRVGVVVNDSKGKHSGYFSIKPTLINLPEKLPPQSADPNYQEAVVELARDRTYTAWIVMSGSQMIAAIDEGKVIAGTRAPLADAKTKFRIEVYDGMAAFQNFTMWQIEKAPGKK